MNHHSLGTLVTSWDLWTHKQPPRARPTKANKQPTTFLTGAVGVARVGNQQATSKAYYRRRKPFAANGDIPPLSYPPPDSSLLEP